MVEAPSAGELIDTLGASLRNTVTLALAEPTELVQSIWIVLLPTERLAVVGLTTVCEPILQVGAGKPAAVKLTSIDDWVVWALLAGELIDTVGA